MHTADFSLLGDDVTSVGFNTRPPFSLSPPDTLKAPHISLAAHMGPG